MWYIVAVALFASSSAVAQTEQCEQIKAGIMPLRITYQLDDRPGKAGGAPPNRTSYQKLITRQGDLVKISDIQEIDGKPVRSEASMLNGFYIDSNISKAKASKELASKNALESRKRFSLSFTSSNGAQVDWRYGFIKKEHITVSSCKFVTIVFERRWGCDDGAECIKNGGVELFHYSPELKVRLKNRIESHFAVAEEVAKHIVPDLHFR